MIQFRIRYVVAGGHVHCRFFSRRGEGAWAKLGDFTMSLNDWEVFCRDRTFRAEILPEDDRMADFHAARGTVLQQLQEGGAHGE